jgi:hypothetical protein
MKTQILLVLLPLMGGCSHEARRVDCEKHLSAINPPTPVVKATGTPAAPTPTPQAETL